MGCVFFQNENLSIFEQEACLWLMKQNRQRSVAGPKLSHPELHGTWHRWHLWGIMKSDLLGGAPGPETPSFPIQNPFSFLIR